MIPRPAQYLLRFDDFCPTMGTARWTAFEQLIGEFGIQPILAVVPENLDPELIIENPAPDFWVRMRSMEAAGCTIALHGYRHLCTSSGRSLIPRHRFSEFAGVAEETQREWIHRGLEILRGHQLNPRLWVAPRHGFDCSTLKALQSEGIFHISDGFARAACVRAGMTWIPQQLWAPAAKSSGLWTICIHSNNASADDLERLSAFLRRHARQFSSFDRVITEHQLESVSAFEKTYEIAALWRSVLSRRMKRFCPRIDR